MALPALPFVFSGLSALLASFGAWILTVLGTLIAGLFGKAILALILVYAFSYFFNVQGAAINWALDKILELMPNVANNLSYTFQLGGIVDALRIVECLLTILNAHFIGLLISSTKSVAGIAKAS